jgi:hypothetical protein
MELSGRGSRWSDGSLPYLTFSKNMRFYIRPEHRDVAMHCLTADNDADKAPHSWHTLSWSVVFELVKLP